MKHKIQLIYPIKEKWICPYCLEPIGYLGRFFSWLFGTQHHNCDLCNVMPPSHPQYNHSQIAAENHIAEIAKCDEINRQEFAMDYFRFGERLEVLQVKYEALQERLERIEKAWDELGKMAEMFSAYHVDKGMIGFTKTDEFRTLAAAIRGE